jgi:hypothetical protein
MHKRQHRTKAAARSPDRPHTDRSADRQAHIDQLLDEALAATFPASDPVSTLAPEEPSLDRKQTRHRRAKP